MMCPTIQQDQFILRNETLSVPLQWLHRKHDLWYTTPSARSWSTKYTVLSHFLHLGWTTVSDMMSTESVTQSSQSSKNSSTSASQHRRRTHRPKSSKLSHRPTRCPCRISAPSGAIALRGGNPHPRSVGSLPHSGLLLTWAAQLPMRSPQLHGSRNRDPNRNNILGFHPESQICNPLRNRRRTFQLS